MNLEKFDSKILNECNKIECYKNNFNDIKLYPYLPNLENPDILGKEYIKEKFNLNEHFNNNIQDNFIYPVQFKSLYNDRKKIEIKKKEIDNDLLLNGMLVDNELFLSRKDIENNMINNMDEITKLYKNKNQNKFFKNIYNLENEEEQLEEEQVEEEQLEEEQL